MVAGIRNTVPLQELEQLDKAAYDELMAIMATLEGHYRDLCDIEFTIERGKLWMLQTRVGKRTAAAAFVIAAQLVDEGVIDLDEALRRVTGAQLAQLMFPRFDLDARRRAARQGHRAPRPGAAVGEAVFDSRRARSSWPPTGEQVILVRRETNPDDLPGMIAAQGILTSRGGKTCTPPWSPAAWARPASAAPTTLDVDVDARAVHRGRRDRRARATSSPSTAPPARSTSARCRCSRRAVVQYFEGELDAGRRPAGRAPCTGCSRTPTHARRLEVRTNADTGDGRRPGPPLRRRRASACAAPSTCSSATGASWSSG